MGRVTWNHIRVKLFVLDRNTLYNCVQINNYR